MPIFKILVCSFVVVLSACSAAPATPDRPATEPRTGPPSVPSNDVEHEPGIYDLSTGEKLDTETFYDRLAEATYVIVGESHPEVADHAVQDRIYRALVKRHDGPVALGMEMVSRPYQVVLDTYVAGTIDEEQMLEELDWATRWGYSSLLYAPMWRTARHTGAPVVALNARRELTRAVSKLGVAGLDPAMKADLPDLDLTDEAHREWMRNIFSSHGMEMEEEKFDRFYQAQVVWDETMAQTAWEFMQANDEVEAMMIVAGRGHTEREWGIPQRLQRRIGDDDEKVITVSPMRTKAPPLEELREKGVSDYVVFED